MDWNGLEWAGIGRNGLKWNGLECDGMGWAVLEWECCLKHPEQGAAEGAPFIADHIIRPTDKAFDDFAGGTIDKAALRKMMGF